MKTPCRSWSARPKPRCISRSARTLRLFRVQPWAKVAIGSGENAGHTLNYTNVVRDVRAVGMWSGHGVMLDLPRDAPHDQYAVVVQQGGGYGRIVGAAMS